MSTYVCPRHRDQVLFFDTPIVRPRGSTSSAVRETQPARLAGLWSKPFWSKRTSTQAIRTVRRNAASRGVGGAGRKNATLRGVGGAGRRNSTLRKVDGIRQCPRCRKFYYRHECVKMP